MIDQFSKWIECVALPNQKAELIAKEFFERFVVTFGCPLTVHTDQGKNFDGNLFKAFCSILQITKTRTTPYHPSSNGKVERCNRSILQMIRCYIEGKVQHWDRDLPSLVMALHATENRSTGFTPNRLMLGREVIMPVDILTGVVNANMSRFESSEWVQKLEHVARSNLACAQRRQKRLYDVKLVEQQYDDGGVVYRLEESSRTGVSKKLLSPWRGPYVVTQSEPPLYSVRDCRGKELTSHHDKLKRCTDRDVPLWVSRLRSNLHRTAAQAASAGLESDEESEDVPSDVVETSTTNEGSLEKEAETGKFVSSSDSETDTYINSDRRVLTTRRGRSVKVPAHLKDYVLY
ncbi:uncharacterized protein LOC132545285 [Ylistrum balloti]|uniref:uncharacterized protein LOC132545285 n=1 Tax=Ylistrum balloti TaxID=509963 RepID=UPI002905CB85|nr:uncharacterized protein LOC132545285 [Ylistrum balloti]